MFRKLRERLSVLLSKRPGRIVLAVILALNVAFIFIAAAIINAMSLTGTENMGFWRSAYYTVTMILDAGCIDYVISDIGSASVALVIVCLVVIVIGMVLFTGAVIGYLTNYISGFIERADGGTHRIVLSSHTVILNWNSRANEIVNDLLYCDKKQTVVILVPEGKEDIERDVEERLSATVIQERANIKAHAARLGGVSGFIYRLTHRFSQRVTVIVREGDPFSAKQLRDISLDHAKSIIILGDEATGTVCKFEAREKLAERPKGNPQIIKALVLVSDIASAASSDDNQKIVVEAEDDWTGELINKIIAFKQVDGKCNIIPVNVNHILGRLLSQFSLMPELNLAYREFFSNKGATFYARPHASGKSEGEYVDDYLKTHDSSIPLALLESGGKTVEYYCATTDGDYDNAADYADTDYRVELDPDYWIEKKNVVILGHNSKIKDIMAGFDGFRDEWNYKNGGEIMDIIVIDDKEHLERMNYFKDYPYVTAAVEADVYDRDKICSTIEKFVDANATDTSVLILSDDLVPADEVDSGAITNLIYVSDILRRKRALDPAFDTRSIDIVVEILDPKHYDVVKSYSVNNVVISNRYISKMITQIGEKDELFDFYTDILSYDEAGTAEYESKEIYIKKVSRYFKTLPPPCTAGELIRAVYRAARELGSHVITLGYVNADGEMILFSGDQTKQRVALSKKDKLIVFADH